MTTIYLELIELKSGKHAKPEEGACVMEVVSIFAGLPFSDHPECTDAVVAAYARALNDVMPDDQRYRLRPFIPRLASTRNGCPPAKRTFLCADRAVRVFAVAALRAAGLDDLAAQLAAVDPITDETSASAAAWSAAGVAGAAARVAWAVARDGASAAAWSAARDGASAAASAAARDGASAAASAAARVAWSAARDGGADPWDEPIKLLADLIALHE